MKINRDQDLETKIIASLERFTHIFRVAIWNSATQTGLSPIQIQFLLFLDAQKVGKRRVSVIAHEFGLTQATVSDSVRVLREKGLLIQKTSTRDKRIAQLHVTAAGKKMIGQLSTWTNEIRDAIVSLPQERREQGLHFLMELLASLHANGCIIPARMCILCLNFRKNAHEDILKPHHCGLLDIALSLSDLKIDCDLHKSARF